MFLVLYSYVNAFPSLSIYAEMSDSTGPNCGADQRNSDGSCDGKPITTCKIYIRALERNQVKLLARNKVSVYCRYQTTLICSFHIILFETFACVLASIMDFPCSAVFLLQPETRITIMCFSLGCYLCRLTEWRIWIETFVTDSELPIGGLACSRTL